ncbi:siderophore ABC transporter substrate-binding protein [Ectopseudomonas mendocina]|uniref:Siderophore ABC transporter substrate-binding protein n=1 Tax=Ectopseudomonas mendocina TaxID=300 RepID=A0ABZ2RIW4_ECTME
MSLLPVNRVHSLLLVTALAAALQGCDKPAESPEQAAAANSASTTSAYEPVSVTHQLGTTVIKQIPQRVVAFDMGEIDTLDQLGAPVVGIAKDYVADFLSKYKDDPNVADVGATVQPNLEKLHAVKPDLILISALQAKDYEEMSQLAPTVHFDMDFSNKNGDILTQAKEHLLTLGRIFDKDDLAREKVAQMDAKIQQVRSVTEGRPEKALIVQHNNGSFTSYGVASRYGYLFDTLGVKPADTDKSPSLHGQSISNEFIQQTDPDILYVIDRTAVMERRPALNRETLENPLLRETKAWKNNRVVFVDSQTWYLCTASFTCLNRIADEVIQGYQ